MFFHVDIDAFFASVEINKNKKIVNLPVIVGGKSSRSVVSSANYIARSYGVKAAMPMAMANALCPKAVNIFIDENSFAWYEQISNVFLLLLKNNFSNLIEQISIDECYLEINNISEKKAVKLGYEMKKLIFDKLNLTVSVGIGANKFVARTATQFGKPNGIFLLNENNFKTKVWPLPIGEMHYVGKKLTEKFNEIGIHTIGDLANVADKETIKAIVGKNFLGFINHANGICHEEINTNQSITKSISCEKTFVSDIYEEQEFLTQLHYLCKRNYLRLISKGMMCKVIHLKIKYASFRSEVFSLTLPKYTKQFNVLFSAATSLFVKKFQVIHEPIRLIGINYDQLIYTSDYIEPRTLFDPAPSKKQLILLKLVRDINNSIGEHCVDIAANLLIYT